MAPRGAIFVYYCIGFRMSSNKLSFRDLALLHALFVVAALLCLLPIISSPVALLAGIALATIFGNPWQPYLRDITSRLLAYSIIGLGAGTNLGVIASVGLHGIGYTMIGITVTTALGLLLGRWMKIGGDLSLLVTIGTAICGGSAIAAVSSVLKSRSHDVAVALATVFALNTVALVIFPPIGHWLALSPHEFGLWSALAIHDTSSVVGATMQYGPEAVQTGTTVKLARALWIVPVTLACSFGQSRVKPDHEAQAKLKIPWFILGYIAAAALATWVPVLHDPGQEVATLAKRFLVMTLFLIGSGLTRQTIQNVGFKPLVMGIILWVCAAGGTLVAILKQWIV